MPNFIEIDHPVIRHHLGILRHKDTNEIEFRARLHYICQLMCYEVTKDLPIREIKIETPLEMAPAQQIKDNIIIISILRAGLGMQNAFLSVLPEAGIGHLGFYRNEETLKPVQYYFNFPKNLAESVVILTDPMLATGGSLDAAIELLKEHGARKIKCAMLVSAQDGIDFVLDKHKDVMIYTAAIDRELNENGYILPGLGDAGDRQFKTP